MGKERFLRWDMTALGCVVTLVGLLLIASVPKVGEQPAAVREET
jgi:hypothetical protein